MAEHYFIGTLLPDIKIGEKPELSFIEFERVLSDNLPSADYKLALQVRGYYTIENMRALWLQEPLDVYGLDAHDLEESMLNTESLPPYLRDFLEKHSSNEKRLRHFPELLVSYFREESKQPNGFVSEYLQFERKLHLIQTAFRAKKLNRDLCAELQFEDADDGFVLELMSQKDSDKFNAPGGFEELQSLLEKHYESPIQLHRALCEYRFAKLEEMAGWDLFSINRILAYMVQLILVERWLKLDRDEGNKIVDQYIKEPT
jgi:hypothetical protein